MYIEVQPIPTGIEVKAIEPIKLGMTYGRRLKRPWVTQLPPIARGINRRKSVRTRVRKGVDGKEKSRDAYLGTIPKVVLDATSTARDLGLVGFVISTAELTDLTGATIMLSVCSANGARDRARERVRKGRRT